MIDFLFEVDNGKHFDSLHASQETEQVSTTILEKEKWDRKWKETAKNNWDFHALRIPIIETLNPENYNIFCRNPKSRHLVAMEEQSGKGGSKINYC